MLRSWTIAKTVTGTNPCHQAATTAITATTLIHWPWATVPMSMLDLMEVFLVVSLVIITGQRRQRRSFHCLNYVISCTNRNWSHHLVQRTPSERQYLLPCHHRLVKSIKLPRDQVLPCHAGVQVLQLSLLITILQIICSQTILTMVPLLATLCRCSLDWLITILNFSLITACLFYSFPGPPQGHHHHHEDLYGNHGLHQQRGGGGHSGHNSANNSSNNISQSMSIAMPQAVKSNSSNGTGRKYQCKMCPQVTQRLLASTN